MVKRAAAADALGDITKVYVLKVECPPLICMMGRQTNRAAVMTCCEIAALVNEAGARDDGSRLMSDRSALVMIVKDEEAGIVEALAYHLGIIGFDSALIYDNGSQDGTVAHIRRMQRYYDIDLVAWPYRRTERSWPQLTAYRDAVERLASRVDWVAFLDVDEALHGVAGGNLPDLLSANRSADQIALNWAIFGSSGHIEAPASLNLDAFTHRAPLSFHLNRHCKVVVRPDRVTSVLNAHACEVVGDTVTAGGHAVRWSSTAGLLEGDPMDAPFRINHYFTRSREHWLKRMARGSLSGMRRAEDWHTHNCNDERDVSAHHFYGYPLLREMERVWPEGAARLRCPNWPAPPPTSVKATSRLTRAS